MRVALDSNILVYAALEPGSSKGKRAADVITRASARGVIALQSLLEFVAVVRKRQPQLVNAAIAQAEAWAEVFELSPTSLAIAKAAHSLVATHGLQVWDAVIYSAAADAKADVFFSEDLQHGVNLNGVRVLNPFVLGSTELDAILPS